mmetsp:Transcript_22627/g.27315  ORF Transcript_22627/g.27315 Transcript_22627/m.27315 type:complete len:82 (-) Transcript_22627:123-368(-)
MQVLQPVSAYLHRTHCWALRPLLRTSAGMGCQWIEAKDMNGMERVERTKRKFSKVEGEERIGFRLHGMVHLRNRDDGEWIP